MLFVVTFLSLQAVSWFLKRERVRGQPVHANGCWSSALHGCTDPAGECRIQPVHRSARWKLQSKDSQRTFVPFPEHPGPQWDGNVTFARGSRWRFSLLHTHPCTTSVCCAHIHASPQSAALARARIQRGVCPKASVTCPSLWGNDFTVCVHPARSESPPAEGGAGLSSAEETRTMLRWMWQG